MPNPIDCHDHAFKCSRLAATFADGPTWQMFLDMAQTWLKRANELEKSEERLNKSRTLEGAGSYRFGSAITVPRIERLSEGEGFVIETAVSAIAAVLTTAAFIPQAYKIIRSRETAGVSIWMHITFAAGVSFWFALGILLWNWPMMIANAVTFILTLVIIAMKLYLD